jgi:hypothetical protein
MAAIGQQGRSIINGYRHSYNKKPALCKHRPFVYLLRWSRCPADSSRANLPSRCLRIELAEVSRSNKHERPGFGSLLGFAGNTRVRRKSRYGLRFTVYASMRAGLSTGSRSWYYNEISGQGRACFTPSSNTKAQMPNEIQSSNGTVLAFKHLTFIWNLDFDILNWVYPMQCYLGGVQIFWNNDQKRTRRVQSH